MAEKERITMAVYPKILSKVFIRIKQIYGNPSLNVTSFIIQLNDWDGFATLSVYISSIHKLWKSSRWNLRRLAASKMRSSHLFAAITLKIFFMFQIFNTFKTSLTSSSKYSGNRSKQSANLSVCANTLPSCFCSKYGLECKLIQ